MSTLSAGVPENIDFDGSTLTQQNDWLLMSTAAAEDGSSPNSSGGRSRGRRNNRKRTVLPLELFKNAIDGPEKLPPAKPAAVVLKSRSTETLLPLPWCSEDGIVIATAGSGLSCPTMRDVADAADSTALRVAPLPPYAKPGYLPSVPPSMRIVVSTQNVTRLRLACTGDSGSWLAARVPHFSTLLVAGIEQAAALQDLALINVGLVAVLPALLRCKDLRRLDMSHNWINSAPGWLSRLQELRHIVLAGNPLATVSADLVEMRSRLETLCLGTGKWSLVSRSESAMVAHSRAEQQRRVCQRIEATANRRMAAFLSSTRLALTPRQHEASLDKAKLLLQAYARILHSQLHEARPWGHSVPLPYLPLPQHLRPVAVPAAGI
ncbi:hypothetical protein FBU59_000932 [Linderina macrospora]|uniref:Uncharacterized protein n=1 Tax=Linderina macrospora TaxID=4868 RepID=A0ACC1JFD8_9FUNG|nr:hypothetical protein FBU59_000932 [Linderina macrospora]